MYTLNIVNNYSYDCVFTNQATGKDAIVNHNYQATFNNMGSGYLTVPGIGSVNFLDLGDKKIEGYPIPKETWGVLVRFSTVEAYYRYEGGGELTATIDQYGSCTLSTSNGTMITISLPEFTIKEQ